MRINRSIEFEFNCRERESSFRNSGGGEYCSVCKTVVFDFTEMPVEEIQQIILANGGSACGKIYAEQLCISEKKRRSTLRLAVAGIAAMLSLTSVEGQTSQSPVKTEQVDFLRTRENSVAQIIPGTGCELKGVGRDSLPPDEKVKMVKKRTFLRIGNRRFYVMNKFPFIGTSKQYLRGKFKF